MELVEGKSDLTVHEEYYTARTLHCTSMYHFDVFLYCRYFPCCVVDLNDAGVIKVAAGTFHSLAQTAYSQVFCCLIRF